jgi:hypothetical protein
MAFTAKFTAVRGKPSLGDIAIGAGTAEAGRDVISLNIDADKISKGEALVLIDSLKQAVHATRWPVN